MIRFAIGYLTLGTLILLTGCMSPSGAANAPGSAAATPIAFKWAATVYTGAGDTGYNAVTYDSSNYRWYAAGWVQGGPSSYDFGDSHSVSGLTAANKNAVLVKYAELGLPEWTAVATGSGDIVFNAVVLSGSSVIAVGTMLGTATHNFGNSRTATGVAPGKNAVIVSYSKATGATEWVWTPAVWGADLVLDSELLAVAAGPGGLYAVGAVSSAGVGSLNFGTGSATSTTGGGTQGLVVSLDPANSGTNARWATISRGTAGPKFRGVTVDGSGHVDVVGTIGSAATTIYLPTTDVGVASGYQSVSSAGSQFENLVAAQFLETSNGTLTGGDCLWITTTASGDVKNRFNAVAVDTSGNLYAVGSIDGTVGITFTAGSVSVQGNDTLRNPLLVKLNSTGTVQWARSTTAGSGPCEYLGVSLDSGTGALWAAGAITYANLRTFSPGVTFGGPGTDRNPLVVRYNLSGSALEAAGATDVPTAAEFAAVVAAAGRIGMVGTVTGTATSHFGSYANTMPSNSGSNVLIATAW